MNEPENHRGTRPRSKARNLTPYSSPDERRHQGKALRDKVPREDQAGWESFKGRRDPVELLIESNTGRLPQLIPIRFGRMVQSPFAFFRGAAAIMAADLAHTPRSGLIVQACGDAHLLNFGGFATPERNLVFDINDLDETLPAPWEWDLKRLAASTVIAGRYLELSESDVRRAATATVRSYREHMSDYAFMRALDVWYETVDLDRLLKQFSEEAVRKRVEQWIEKLRKRSVADHDFPKLAEQRGTVARIKDNPPLIFMRAQRRRPRLQDQLCGGGRGLSRLAARTRPRAVCWLPALRPGDQGGRSR